MMMRVVVVLELDIQLELRVFHLHDKRYYHQVLGYLMMILHLLSVDSYHMQMQEIDHR
jgi:hypothetical protein